MDDRGCKLWGIIPLGRMVVNEAVSIIRVERKCFGADVSRNYMSRTQVLNRLVRISYDYFVSGLDGMRGNQ